jgi:predicted transcriptional regulator
MTTVNTKVLTAHIPLPLADQIEAHANRLERSKGWIIKEALADWVDREEARDRLTQEALLDIDRGLFVSHEEVEDWLKDLKKGRSTVARVK